MKAIIVDDEKAARNVLSNLVHISHPEIEIIDSCSDLLDAVSSIKAKKPDVVFLDVEMPQYAGYEINKFFEQIDFQIVFVTAYDKYAVKAFELNAADYLLKPIQRTRLKETIERVKKRHEDNQRALDYKSILAQLDEENAPTVTFSEGGNQHVVKTSDITAIIAQGAYCQVAFNNKESLLLSKNIGSIEKELLVDHMFYRTHRSWLINLREIKSIQKNKEIIVLKSGIEAKLSRFKKESFLEHFEKMIG